MKSNTNTTYLALMEILEAADCLPRNNIEDQPFETLSISLRAWGSPLFKSPSGRTEHIAVVIFMDIVRRFLNANDPQDEEQPLLIDPQYFDTELRVPPKKFEASIALLEETGALTLSRTNQRLWAVPCPEVLAQAILPPALVHFYRQWSLWQVE